MNCELCHQERELFRCRQWPKLPPAVSVDGIIYEAPVMHICDNCIQINSYMLPKRLIDEI